MVFSLRVKHEGVKMDNLLIYDRNRKLSRVNRSPEKYSMLDITASSAGKALVFGMFCAGIAYLFAPINPDKAAFYGSLNRQYIVRQEEEDDAA